MASHSAVLVERFVDGVGRRVLARLAASTLSDCARDVVLAIVLFPDDDSEQLTARCARVFQIPEAQIREALDELVRSHVIVKRHFSGSTFRPELVPLTEWRA